MDFKELVPGPYQEIVPQVQRALALVEAEADFDRILIDPVSMTPVVDPITMNILTEP